MNACTRGDCRVRSSTVSSYTIGNQLPAAAAATTAAHEDRGSGEARGDDHDDGMMTVTRADGGRIGGDRAAGDVDDGAARKCGRKRRNRRNRQRSQQRDGDNEPRRDSVGGADAIGDGQEIADRPTVTE